MSVSISMPQLGESVAEGTIGKWLKQPGDAIARDEPLVEIITDKVTAEMPSPAAGILESIDVVEGATVPVGTVIARIGETSALTAPPVANANVSAPPSNAASPLPDESNGEHRASPLVRRLAREHAVDIAAIQGTGSGGRVTKHDILAYIDAHTVATVSQPAPSMAPVSTTPTAAAAASPVRDDGDQLLPLTSMRRSIAEHMVRSVTTTPHAWCLVEVDATGLVKAREHQLQAWRAREGFELSFLPFFIKAVTESLRDHPIMNATWTESGVLLKRDINIGLAVALEDGLIVPVLHDADRQSIAGLAHMVRDLVTRARQRQLGPSDIQGGTFTVNNTGALGSIMSAPIIPQPQAGIVTMEAIVKRPVVRDDAIAIRSMMNVCMSFDHRVTDGSQGLQFLQSVRRRIEAYGPDTSLY